MSFFIIPLPNAMHLIPLKNRSNTGVKDNSTMSMNIQKYNLTSSALFYQCFSYQFPLSVPQHIQQGTVDESTLCS